MLGHRQFCYTMLSNVAASSQILIFMRWASQSEERMDNSYVLRFFHNPFLNAVKATKFPLCLPRRYSRVIHLHGAFSSCCEVVSMMLQSYLRVLIWNLEADDNFVLLYLACSSLWFSNISPEDEFYSICSYVQNAQHCWYKNHLTKDFFFHWTKLFKAL